jgi:polyphosphate glucokinase
LQILGIDIGGSGIKGAPVDTKKGILTAERHRIATPKPATPAAVAKTVKKLAEHFEWNGLIGCGFPAAIHNGVAVTASNIDKKWIGTDAEKLFRKYTGCPVRIINDADAAGVAEMMFGVGRGEEGLVMMITVGTGIGSSMFYDGELVPNTELGHLIFHKGKIAEWYASDSARKRDKLNWDEWGERFNDYLNYIYSLFYPDLIIVGGGGSKRFEKYSHKIKVNTEVVPAQTLNNAGIIGAAMAARSLRKLIKVKV